MSWPTFLYHTLFPQCLCLAMGLKSMQEARHELKPLQRCVEINPSPYKNVQRWQKGWLPYQSVFRNSDGDAHHRAGVILGWAVRNRHRRGCSDGLWGLESGLGKMDTKRLDLSDHQVIFMRWELGSGSQAERSTCIWGAEVLSEWSVCWWGQLRTKWEHRMAGQRWESSC